jgi:hypothetical protein
MPAKRLLPFLAVAVLLLALACKGDGGSHLPDLTPFDSEGLAKLHEIRDLAAEVRGIGPCEKVNEGTLTREQLTAYYEESEAQLSDKDREELETSNKVMRLLHLIGPQDDLLQSFVGMNSSEVVGLYSNDEHKLILVTDSGTNPDLGTDDEFTIAHEYVHCFQYDTFDLKRLGKLEEKEDKDQANTEYGTTIEALMEGDAMISAISYVGAKLGEEDFNNWINSVREVSSGNEGGSYPPFLERSFDFPYDQGIDFALYLWKKGGWDELNKAYDNPPSTTEQVLHPEKYVAGEKADDLKLPDLSDDLGKRWKQLDDDVFGEFDVYNYLLTLLGDESVASAAAAGWGGGRMAVYSREDYSDRVLVHIVLTWDTPADATEFLTEYLKSVEAANGQQDLWDRSASAYGLFTWDDEDEHIYAGLEKGALTIVIAADREDRDAALAAMSLPSPGATPTPP